jgi:hypothetical protein
MRFTLTPLNWLIAIAGLALWPIGGYWLMRNMWAAIFMTGAWLALVVFGASDNAFERNALLEEVGRIARVTAQRQPRARSGL